MKQKPVSFHVPGHKSGGIVPAGMEAFKEILSYDLTEIEGMDDLHDPTGPIKEAEELLVKVLQCFKELLFSWWDNGWQLGDGVCSLFTWRSCARAMKLS